MIDIPLPPLSDEDAAIITRIITDYLTKEKPYLVDIEELLRGVDDGTVEITLRVYRGRVTDLVHAVSVKRKVYK